MMSCSEIGNVTRREERQRKAYSEAEIVVNETKGQDEKKKRDLTFSTASVSTTCNGKLPSNLTNTLPILSNAALAITICLAS